MGTTTVQLRTRGSLTIPAEVRQRYGYDDGDVFTLIDLGDGTLVFSPRIAWVPKLVAEMQAIREEVLRNAVQKLPGILPALNLFLAHSVSEGPSASATEKRELKVTVQPLACTSGTIEGGGRPRAWARV